MFSMKQTPPPEPPPEPNGLRIQLNLSEAALVRLLPWAVYVLVGAGVLGYVHPQLVPPHPDASANSVERVEGDKQP